MDLHSKCRPVGAALHVPRPAPTPASLPVEALSRGSRFAGKFSSLMLPNGVSRQITPGRDACSSNGVAGVLGGCCSPGPHFIWVTAAWTAKLFLFVCFFQTGYCLVFTCQLSWMFFGQHRLSETVFTQWQWQWQLMILICILGVFYSWSGSTSSCLQQPTGSGSPTCSSFLPQSTVGRRYLNDCVSVGVCETSRDLSWVSYTCHYRNPNHWSMIPNPSQVCEKKTNRAYSVLHLVYFLMHSCIFCFSLAACGVFFKCMASTYFKFYSFMWWNSIKGVTW